MLNWTSDKETMRLEGLVADRAVAMAKKHGAQLSKLDAVMDIDACHSNGCPLKLEELLKANDGDFAHDVFSIRNHLNRSTGKLEDCFDPRYSRAY